MKFATLLLAAGALVLSACATTQAAPASHAALQETANLMVSITQHGEGADIPDLEAQLDAHAAANPNDPFVLKLVAQSRRTLSDYSQSREERVRLRHAALAEIEKAIQLATPDLARIVMLNGQETEIDLKDLPDLRAQYLHQVQTDR
jgi:hypothetical protein